jgi:membrane-bound toxin of toxin-antitoxin system
MARMKTPPRLRIELRPSRPAAVALAIAIVATAALVAAMPGGLLVRALAIVGTTLIGLFALRRVLQPPLLLHVGIDRRVSVTGADARTSHGRVHADTCIGALLTALVWVPDGARPWHRARTVLILPDMLPAEDFRRLRVYLRYGRDPGEPDPDTSGVAAG